MKLSKQATVIAECCTKLPTDLAKMIGHFASFDLAGKAGQAYYQVAKRIGCSYLRLDNAVILPMCQNDYINLFRIEEVTPCSYVIRYEYTYVLTRIGLSFVRYCFVDSREAPVRRIYPLRKIQDQQLIKTFVQIHDMVIKPQRIEQFGNSQSFFVNFTPELEDQLGFSAANYLG